MIPDEFKESASRPMEDDDVPWLQDTPENRQLLLDNGFRYGPRWVATGKGWMRNSKLYTNIQALKLLHELLKGGKNE